MKIRLKHKKITFLIIFLVLPIATIVSVNADDTTEIDFVIYLRAGEQYLVDAMINSVESFGFSVNAIYCTFEEWGVITSAGAFDLAYGGISISYNIDDIFNLAYCLAGLDWLVLKHDDAKLHKFVNQLIFDYYLQAPYTAPEDMPALIADMIDKFHDVEERLWEKQLIIPLAQYSNPDLVFTPALFLNAMNGKVFADENLRFSLASLIDRSLFVDFFASLVPFLVYETYHMYGWSSYHNFDLPNCLPT